MKNLTEIFFDQLILRSILEPPFKNNTQLDGLPDFIRWIETRSNNHHWRGGRAGAKFVGALKFSARPLA